MGKTSGGVCMTRARLVLAAAVFALLLPIVCFGQLTAENYERAAKLRDKFQGLAVNIPECKKFKRVR
jgi:hypothetical protein